MDRETPQASQETQAMTLTDIAEGARFFDPRVNQGGKLTLRTYHRTKVWMMLYDSGEIAELCKGDLDAIKKA